MVVVVLKMEMKKKVRIERSDKEMNIRRRDLLTLFVTISRQISLLQHNQFSSVSVTRP